MPPRITVEAGVEIPLERGHSYSQALDDAIKISIVPDEAEMIDTERCHFLQFITRQAPDMFRANLSEPIHGIEPGVAWETADTHYMDNPSIAKWRVDSNAHPSPFYDEGGAHEHGSDGSYSMYDQPGYANGDLERIIGCTFVIANEQVIGEVLWSRQYTIGEHGPSSQYQYMIDNTVTEIPDWAIHCLNDEYQLNASVVDDDAGEQRAYAIPDFLARAPLAQNAMEAQISMSQELQKLPAPPNWILREDPMFSVLMTPPAIATHTEEKEEDLNPTVIYREAAENLRAQAISHNIQPVAAETQDDISDLSNTGATQRK